MKEPINLNIIDEEFYSTHFSLYSEEFEVAFTFMQSAAGIQMREKKMRTTF